MLGEEILVESLRVDAFVLEEHSFLISVRRVSEVEIHGAGQDDEEDEKGAQQHSDLVIRLEQESGQRN